MALEKVAHVGLGPVRGVGLNQLLFLQNEVSTVLHDELRVRLQYLDCLCGRDVVLGLHKVKQTSQI